MKKACCFFLWKNTPGGFLEAALPTTTLEAVRNTPTPPSAPNILLWGGGGGAEGSGRIRGRGGAVAPPPGQL